MAMAMVVVQAFPRGRSLSETPCCPPATPALASSTYPHSSFVRRVRCSSSAAAAARRTCQAMSARRHPLVTSFITSVEAYGSNASVIFGEATCLLARTQLSSHNQEPKRSLKILALFGLGVPELVVIAGVTVLIFGPKKLPEIGKTLGKTMKSFQQATDEFQTELKGDRKHSSPGSPNPEISSAESLSENENNEKRA